MTLADRFSWCGALIVAALLPACSDDANSHKDATIDSQCGADVFFTGEVVDWDSTETQFCGVFHAKLQVHGGSPMVSTNPNGRFELCIAPAATTQIDITPPVDSVCAGGGSYAIPGIAVANQATINTGKLFSARAITTQRVATFYPQFGLTYDPAKAGVFVHVEGTPQAVAITAAHGTALSYDGTTWTAGATGKNVFFPNVDVAGGMTGVTAGSAVGASTVVIAANTVTYLTVVAP